jgi:predicted acyl esterase
MLSADAKAMPKGKFVKVVIPLYYQGHVYRAGTRIRVTIAAPNGAQPVWSFSHTVPAKTSRVSIVMSSTQPSSVVLPVVAGVTAGASQPPCPSLRNEPCRGYARIVNRTASS